VPCRFPPYSKYLQKGISLEALLAEYSPESSEEVSHCCEAAAAAADCSDDEAYHGGAASSQNSEVTPQAALDLPEVTGGLLLAEDPRDEIQHLLADLSDAITGYEEQAALGAAQLWETAHLVGLDLDLSEAPADAAAPLHTLPQEPATAGSAATDAILVMQRAQLVSLQQGVRLLGVIHGTGVRHGTPPAVDRHHEQTYACLLWHRSSCLAARHASALDDVVLLCGWLQPTMATANKPPPNCQQLSVKPVPASPPSTHLPPAGQEALPLRQL
jgi:hypothetical protein